MKLNDNQKGFTIVELLIVIVVIGILAAITIVAFNGIQNRGNTTAAQSNATAVMKKLESYNSVEGTYPATVAAMNTLKESEITGSGITNTTGVSASNGKTHIRIQYCSTGTSPNLTYVGGRAGYWDFGGSTTLWMNAGTTSGTGVTCTNMPAS